jgi:ABC-type histidine transport system ATPase subunit
MRCALAHCWAHEQRLDLMTLKLEVRGIEKRFGEHAVLKGVSLAANAGDVIAMIGSSGSGKSTFLRCINLLERPNAGSIAVAGEELKLKLHRDGTLRACDSAQLARLRAKATMVFQQFNLWSHLSVLDNVTAAPCHVLGLPLKEAQARAERYLEKVGMADFCARYPAQLSGGQQQRVAIARALAMEPEVLLFDEPTSALDPERVGEVLQVMRALASEGRTMVIVTHEMNFARDVANQVLFLNQGEVLEQGEPKALFAAPASERLRQFLSGTLR